MQDLKFRLAKFEYKAYNIFSAFDLGGLKFRKKMRKGNIDMKLSEMNKDNLSDFLDEAKTQYEAFKSQGLKLDMSRGKPSPAQLDLSNDMLTCINGDCIKSESGLDCRNYGVLDGIDEAKRLLAPMLGVNINEVIVGGNSSLQLMYDTIMKAMVLGTKDSDKPWGKYDKIKWLCPAPGYDRHFAICESLGIEMITIPMNSEGPDMDMVEKLVSEDETVKGIWCVPMYANPTGITYSDEVVRRFAALSPAAKDFRIFWDNAYCVHHLCDDHDKLLNILDECKKTGKQDMVYIFASTSKISFSGSGLAAIGASEANINALKKQLAFQTIGFDKINQLRHARFFKDFDGIKAQMRRHMEIIKPKFDMVIKMLNSELKPLGIGSWHEPKGGYFISFDGPANTAKRIVSLCKDGGVVLTGAGASYPYGKDPEDKNIRIAPTYPSVDELEKAMELFCIAAKIAAAEKLLEG